MILCAIHGKIYHTFAPIAIAQFAELETRSNIADAEFARQQLLMQASVSVLTQSGQMKLLLLSLLQR